MPAQATPPCLAASAQLKALGLQIRAHRKALRLSAAGVAEASGLSRVTLYRIEHGEPAVTIGAYLKVLTALGLELGPVRQVGAAAPPRADDRSGWIPARVRLSDYAQLRQLAWPIQGIDTLTPAEALSLYERNARHLVEAELEPRERQLIDALRLGLDGRERDV